MTRITAVAVIVALLQTAVFHAQAPVQTPDGWDTAVTAPPGTRVRLTLLNGTIVKGLLAEARADALVMKDNELERGSSCRVRVRCETRRRSSAPRSRRLMPRESGSA